MRPPAAAGVLLAILGVGALSSIAWLLHREALGQRRAEDIGAHVTVPSPVASRILALGENELAADLAWLRTLVYYGDGLIYEHGMPDVEKLLEVINRLDPWFKRPYLWGAHATTFRRGNATQEEYWSSIAILRRGVEQFPSDWDLAWLLGIRLFFDVKAPAPAEQERLREEGAMYIERAMRLPGAPGDLPLLAASLRTRLGQKERALRELREMILNTEDDDAREKLEARYALMVSQTASTELGSEARKLDAEWKAQLPYVPRTLYILLGPPPPPAIDLGRLAAGETFSAAAVETAPPASVAPMVR